MAGLSATTVLEKISQGHLECPICCERFDQPKILNCLHSFCEKCLRKMTTDHPDQEQIMCPVCRQRTPLSEKGIAGILNNFSMLALVDEVTQQEGLVKGQQSKIICEECEEQAEAMSRCLECREYLCEACHSAHKRSKRTKSHETASIDDLRLGKATFESRLRAEVPKCQKHSFQELIFYCQTCACLICSACTALDHRAPDHQVCDIADAVPPCEEKVTKLVEQAEGCLTRFKAEKAKAKKAHIKHKDLTLEKLSIITEKAELVIARIRRNEQHLKDKVTQVCGKQDQKFEDNLARHEENIQETSNTVERVKNVMEQLNQFDLLKLQDSLCKNLEDAIKRTIPAPIQGMIQEDFKQTYNFNPAELDILFAERPLSVPEQVKLMKVGEKVVRGPDWEWGNQDGYPPGEGTISKELNANGWVKVRWAHNCKTEMNYRMGAEGKYDLQLTVQKDFGLTDQI